MAQASSPFHPGAFAVLIPAELREFPWDPETARLHARSINPTYDELWVNMEDALRDLTVTTDILKTLRDAQYRDSA